ncbi:MAG: trypsin-like peptidase domain-containing protein, partial [Planctomycetes bacterium]|nr:trypsin-like peptidase domain-containing protein [Planctomycetota bacterium]
FECRVKLRDDQQFPARVINTSRENDLALLLISPEDGVSHRFPPIEMGDSDSLMIGETVIAIGNPRGQVNTVTTGVLSAVGRSLSVQPRGERRPIQFDMLLQHDAAINPGNSGGGLVDLTGKLIGINTLMQAESQNINFAIPVNHVRTIFEQDLLNVSRLAIWFGIETAARDGRFAITRVMPASPAARAGLQVGDAIDQVGERKTVDDKSFATALITYRVGQRVPFLVERAGAQDWKYVDAWSRSAGTILDVAGCVVETVDKVRERNVYRNVLSDLIEIYRFGGGNFDVLRVTELEENGPAAKFGLREGDYIVGYIVESDDYETWLPLTGDIAQLASLLQATGDGRSPRLSVWRQKDGLLSGRMIVRKR